MQVTIDEAFRAGLLCGVLGLTMLFMFLSYVLFPLIDYLTQKLERKVVKMIIEDIRKEPKE